MLKKLRLKFTAINMGIVALMLMVIFTLSYQSTKSDLEEQSMRTLQSLAADPLQMGALEGYKEEVRIPYFTLQINSRGDLFASGGGYFDLSDTDFLQNLIDSVLSSQGSSGVIDEYKLRYLWSAGPSSQCLAFVDISGELSTLRGLIRNYVFIGILALALFLPLSLLLARWIVKPVDAAWKQQKQFVADASHELKTPLTVIMTNAELLKSPGYDESRRSQFSENILSMSREMRQLVEGLLELARADSGQKEQSFSWLELSRLVSECTLPFEPLFFESGLDFETSIEPGISLTGNEQLLRRALDILLDNARKYSLPGGPVCLSLSRQGHSHCLIKLTNPSQELSREELKSIFMRFYRQDKARSRDGGYGLGLPIAESAVKAHRGRLWAEYSAGKISFHMLLPCD